MPSRRTRILGSCAAAAILLLAPLAGKLKIAHAAARAGEQTTKAETATPATTTEKDQTDLSVTVYNSNLALVRDVRQIHLQSGVFPLRFEDVAASIMPATVHFRSLTDPAKLSVVEQNYEYDLLDPQKLLQKYVGREVTLVRAETDAGSTKWVETKALLLSDNGWPVWKIGDEIVTGMTRGILPVSRFARESLQPADAGLDARQSRRGSAARRSFLSDEQHELERGLRPHRGARREDAPISTAG